MYIFCRFVAIFTLMFLFEAKVCFGQDDWVDKNQLISFSGSLSSAVSSGLSVNFRFRTLNMQAEYAWLPAKHFGVGMGFAFATDFFSRRFGVFPAVWAFPLGVNRTLVPFASFATGYLNQRIDFTDPGFPPPIQGFYTQSQLQLHGATGIIVRLNNWAGIEVKAQFAGKSKLTIPVISPDPRPVWALRGGFNLWIPSKKL